MAILLAVQNMGASAFAPGEKEILLGNDFFQRSFVLSGEQFFTRSIGDGKRCVPVSGEEFVLFLKDGRRIAGTEMSVLSIMEGADPKKKRIEILFTGNGLSVLITYTLAHDQHFARKSLEIQPSGPHTPVIEKVELEHMEIKAAAAHQGFGQPAFFESEGLDFFVGFEHPAGFSSLQHDTLSICHHPASAPPFRSKPAVLGAAMPGKSVRDSFFTYLDTIRRTNLPSLFVNYNTWWTLMPPTEKNCLELIALFHRKLFSLGENFDTFTIDDGWDNKDSLWDIRGDRFPRGFLPIREALAESGAALGLWLSPSSGYGHAAWGGRAGYEVAESNFVAFSELLCIKNAPLNARPKKF